MFFYFIRCARARKELKKKKQLLKHRSAVLNFFIVVLVVTVSMQEKETRKGKKKKIPPPLPSPSLTRTGPAKPPRRADRALSAAASVLAETSACTASAQGEQRPHYARHARFTRLNRGFLPEGLIIIKMWSLTHAR